MRKGVLDENALFVFNCVQNFSRIFALRLLFNADFRQVARRETNPVAILRALFLRTQCWAILTDAFDLKLLAPATQINHSPTPNQTTAR
jgi:hypothetical protein